ncbi:MAG: hypothetical protein R3B60_02310 [Candidatus Paceibacterota bacterium]
MILITIGILSVISYNNQDKEINHVSPSEMDNNTKPDINTDEVTKQDNIKYEPLKFPDNNLDTSDWKTYQNEEFGFEVKYPSDWEVEVSKKDFLIRPITKIDPNDDGGVYISVSDLSLNDYVENRISSDVSLKGWVVNNNMQGVIFNYKLGVWSEGRGLDQRKVHQSYLFDLGKYRISFYEPSDIKYRTKVLEKVVLSLVSL